MSNELIEAMARAIHLAAENPLSVYEGEMEALRQRQAHAAKEFLDGVYALGHHDGSNSYARIRGSANRMEGPMTPEEVAEQAYSAGNLVTCDGYYEFDLDAAAAVIRTAMNEAATALQSLAASVEGLTHQRDFLQQSVDLSDERIAALEAQLAEARDKALEEAAKVVEEQTDYSTITPFVHRGRVVHAIRALKGSQQ